MDLSAVAGSYGLVGYAHQDSPVEHQSAFGTLTLNADGTLNASFEGNSDLDSEVLSGTSGGTYSVAANGTVKLTLSAWDDEMNGFIDADGTLVLAMASASNSKAAGYDSEEMYVATKLAANQTTATLAGSYGIVGYAHQDSGEYQSAYGNLTLNADGTLSVTFSANSSNGSSVETATSTGTYTVAADGKITFTTTAWNDLMTGYVGTDGTLVLSMASNPVPVGTSYDSEEIYVAHKMSSGLTQSSVAGTYGIAGIAHQDGTPGENQSGFATVTLNADGTAVVAMTANSDADSTVQTGTFNGTFSVTSDGAMSLTVTEFNDTMHGFISSDGSLLLAMASDSATEATSYDSEEIYIGSKLLAVSNVVTGTAGMDRIVRGDGDFVIDAGEGNNSVTVGNGDNAITAGAGNDKILTGSGDNTIDAGNGNNGVTTGAGNDSITTGAGNDKIIAGGGNNVVVAGEGNNNVTTGDGNDDITTGGGNDKIIAGGGSNMVVAGEGNNNVTTGDGNDDITTGAGNDKIIAGGGTNSIDAGNGNNGVTTGEGADEITTGAGNDKIVAGGGDNVINAGDGTNGVTTGDGNDEITTGGGNDKIMAGNGNNTIETGAGMDGITTGGGNDLIFAGDGNDKILAGAGDDRIDGGNGADKITTGDGADTIVIGNLATGGFDSIGDFSVSDVLELDTAVFASLVGASAANFHIGTAAADADDYLIYNVSRGALYYDADGNGSASSQIQIAALKGAGAATLSFDDFQFSSSLPT